MIRAIAVFHMKFNVEFPCQVIDFPILDLSCPCQNSLVTPKGSLATKLFKIDGFQHAPNHIIPRVHRGLGVFLFFLYFKVMDMTKL